MAEPVCWRRSWRIPLAANAEEISNFHGDDPALRYRLFNVTIVRTAGVWSGLYRAAAEELALAATVVRCQPKAKRSDIQGLFGLNGLLKRLGPNGLNLTCTLE